MSIPGQILTWLMETGAFLMTGIGDIWDWLNTPIGIGEWSVSPLAIFSSTGITIFLAIIVAQIIKATVPLA